MEKTCLVGGKARCSASLTKHESAKYDESWILRFLRSSGGVKKIHVIRRRLIPRGVGRHDNTHVWLFKKIIMIIIGVTVEETRLKREVDTTLGSSTTVSFITG